jgi:hypothetical protein
MMVMVIMMMVMMMMMMIMMMMMMMMMIIIIIIIIIKLRCSDECTFLSIFLQSLIFTPSSPYPTHLVTGWLMAVSSHCGKVKIRISTHCHKCRIFVTLKKPGNFSSRTEFSGTPWPSCLKRTKPGPSEENYSKWDPYHHIAAPINLRHIKDVYV